MQLQNDVVRQIGGKKIIYYLSIFSNVFLFSFALFLNRHHCTRVEFLTVSKFVCFLVKLINILDSTKDVYKSFHVQSVTSFKCYEKSCENSETTQLISHICLGMCWGGCLELPEIWEDNLWWSCAITHFWALSKMFSSWCGRQVYTKIMTSIDILFGFFLLVKNLSPRLMLMDWF